MFEELATLDTRFAELEKKLIDPAICADGQAFAATMKEYRQAEPLITAYRAYQRAEREANEAMTLTKSSDTALAALAAEELKFCRAEQERYAAELRRLLVPRDPYEGRNIIVEIRAGAGGEEAALFAGVLYRMYTMYAAAQELRTVCLDAHETELGGFKEITFSVEGADAYSNFKYESGVHRVQRVPVTESQGRIQTSTVTVAILPEAETVEVNINPADIIFETCKSSGAGGQHINKTESAVRLTHKPSGLVVECQAERSQLRNRERAMQMLSAKLLEQREREQSADIAGKRRTQVGTGDRSERIRTYNYPQGRVTDHRIGLSLYSLEKILNGDLCELVRALQTAEAAAQA